jgi:hypothetical protein
MYAGSQSVVNPHQLANIGQYVIGCAEGTLRATLYSTHAADGLMVPVDCQPAVVRGHLDGSGLRGTVGNQYEAMLAFAAAIAESRLAFVRSIPSAADGHLTIDAMIAQMRAQVDQALAPIQTGVNVGPVQQELNDWLSQWRMDPLGSISLTRFVPVSPRSQSGAVADLENCISYHWQLLQQAIVYDQQALLQETLDQCIEPMLAVARLLVSGGGGQPAFQAMQKLVSIQSVNLSLTNSRAAVGQLDTSHRTPEYVAGLVAEIKRNPMAEWLVGAELERWKQNPQQVIPQRTF